MNTPINDGGPAFPARPTEKLIGGGLITAHLGMTLRDHFAGLAMQGICASSPTDDFTNKIIAWEAYNLADEMIKARSA